MQNYRVKKSTKHEKYRKIKDCRKVNADVNVVRSAKSNRLDKNKQARQIMTFGHLISLQIDQNGDANRVR